MGKSLNRRRWKRLLATIKKHEEKRPELVPYGKAIQEFLRPGKTSKGGRGEIGPVLPAAVPESDPR